MPKLSPKAGPFGNVFAQETYMSDKIPPDDHGFDVLQAKLGGAIAANPQKFGVTPADVLAVQAAQAVWSPAYAAHIKAQQDALTATQAKKGARTALELVVRGVAKKIDGTHGMTDAIRSEAGLPPADTVRTAIGAPTTTAHVRIETTGHYTLVLHFVDEMTPLKLAKPHGVHGLEIYSHVGTTPPADPSGYTFLATDTRTPYTDVHPAADAGKTAYYLCRWTSTKGEPGPWSDVVSAIIPN